MQANSAVAQWISPGLDAAFVDPALQTVSDLPPQRFGQLAHVEPWDTVTGAQLTNVSSEEIPVAASDSHAAAQPVDRDSACNGQPAIRHSGRPSS